MDIDVDIDASEEEAILFANIVGYFDELVEEGADGKSLATMMMTFSTSYLYSFFSTEKVDEHIEQIKKQILNSKFLTEEEKAQTIRH